jgi:hypothetical protein
LRGATIVAAGKGFLLQGTGKAKNYDVTTKTFVNDLPNSQGAQAWNL